MEKKIMREKLLFKFIKEGRAPERGIEHSYSLHFDYLSFTVIDKKKTIEAKIGDDMGKVLYYGDKEKQTEEEIFRGLEDSLAIATEASNILGVLMKEYGEDIEFDSHEGEIRIFCQSQIVFIVKYVKDELCVIYSGSLYDEILPYDYSDECFRRLLTIMAEKTGLPTRSSVECIEKVSEDLKREGYNISTSYSDGDKGVKNIMAVGSTRNIVLNNFNVFGEYDIEIGGGTQIYSIRKTKKDNYSLSSLLDTIDFIEKLKKDFGGAIKVYHEKFLELYIKNEKTPDLRFHPDGVDEPLEDERSIYLSELSQYFVPDKYKKKIINQLELKYGNSI